jgi:hypothetical protein
LRIVPLKCGNYNPDWAKRAVHLPVPRL